MASAVQQFVIKPRFDVVLGMRSYFGRCSIPAPAAAGERHGATGQGMPDTMDGRQYRGPGIRGAKHQVGVETGLLVEEKKHE